MNYKSFEISELSIDELDFVDGGGWVKEALKAAAELVAAVAEGWSMAHGL